MSDFLKLLCKKNTDPGLPVQMDLGSLHVEAIKLVTHCRGKGNTDAGRVNDIYHVYLSH